MVLRGADSKTMAIASREGFMLYYNMAKSLTW